MAKKNGNNGNNIFVSITNRQIYQELTIFKAENAKQHQEIMGQIGKYLNDVSNLKYAMSGLLGLSILTLGWFISHLI